MLKGKGMKLRMGREWGEGILGKKGEEGKKGRDGS